MIEREQLLKERGQILQEMQVGLRTLDETRERLDEMDRLQAALMTRLSHARQKLSSPDQDDDLSISAFGEGSGDDGL